jgi:hypothetical protein
MVTMLRILCDLAAFPQRSRLLILALSALAAATLPPAAQAKTKPAPPSLVCEEAIGEAARTTQVPSRLMAAIGLVETGRQDPVTGAFRPWPWSINAAGTGFYFTSKLEAIAAVRTLQASGVRSIDVGCMQINLVQHPDAFATLDEAFDPKRNAIYAGRFLTRLHQRSGGDWMTAAGWYHSTTPDLAADYTKKVSAILPGVKIPGHGWLLNQDVLTLHTASPILGRNGMILPSVRLNAAGQVPPVTSQHLVRLSSRPAELLAGRPVYRLD